MMCLFCQTQDTKVIDSRLVDEGARVRRRRECLECGERFTTFEAAELMLPRVIKRSGQRCAFSIEKLRTGLLKALEKRPVTIEAVDMAVQRILRALRLKGEREVSSRKIGDLVMEALRNLDKVAYVRFASVYRNFEDVNAFHHEIRRLQADVPPETETNEQPDFDVGQACKNSEE